MTASNSARRGARLISPASGLALAAFVLAVMVAWCAASWLRLDLAYTATETELSFWGRGHYLPSEATWARAGRELDTLLSRAPVHPDYLSLAAYRYTWLAYWEDDPVAALPYAVQAVNAQFAAQQMRPAYRQGWAKMVGYARRAGTEERAVMLSRLAQHRFDALAPDVRPASSM